MANTNETVTIVTDAQFADVPESLKDIKGIEALADVKANLSSLGKSLAVATRAVTTKAYSVRNIETQRKILGDFHNYVKSLNRNAGSCIRWAYESLCGLSFDKEGKYWTIQNRAYQRQMTANLKDTDLLASWEESKKLAQKANRKAIDESEEFQNNDTTGFIIESLERLHNRKSSALESARSWSDTKKNKSEVIKFLETEVSNVNAVKNFLSFCRMQNKTPAEVMRQLREINA